MEKERITLFSDGFLAIVITIMVLELKAPLGDHWADLREIFPELLSYVLSFVYVAIYWNNHHHLFQTVARVTGTIMWANMHLLFWLSLIPLATGWLQQNHYATAPTAFYGFILLMAAIAYYFLQRVIIHSQGKSSVLRQALGRDTKGKLSPLLYLTGILIAYVSPLAANLIYAGMACLWLVPDRRIERHIERPKPL